VELFNILEKGCCKIGLQARNKREVLTELAQLACRNSHLSEDRVEEIANALEKREAQGSTGFGDEIAIPHARLKNVDEFILAIGVHQSGVDFDTMDRRKAKLFFVILGPEEKVNEHLKILAAVSRALGRGNAKKEILRAESDIGLFEAFLRNTEEVAEKKVEKPKMKLLVLILFMEDKVYEVMEFFLQRGIDGATIIESSGMGQYISTVPLFATFIGFMRENKNRSKTILAMVPEGTEADIIQGIEGITGGDLDRTQGAMVFTLDVAAYKGDMKMF